MGRYWEQLLAVGVFTKCLKAGKDAISQIVPDNAKWKQNIPEILENRGS